MKANNQTDLENHLQIGFAVSYILIILPLSIYVLYLGLLRRKQQSNATPHANHSDFFAYNMAVMELIGVLGFILWFIDYSGDFIKLMVNFPRYGESFFPVYTSVEQYTAAVYPITYLSLKRNAAGLWIRYSSTSIVWFISFVKTMLMLKIHSAVKFLFAAEVIEIAILFLAMLFCSVSVLVVLFRPKPGSNAKTDKSKLKPFLILFLVMFVLVIRFVWNLWLSVVCAISDRGSVHECLVLAQTVNWVNFLTMLVTPFLYLQRAGKLC